MEIIPSIINNAPPSFSFLHAIHVAKINISEGIRCIKSPTKSCKGVYPAEKTSNAKRLIKAM